MEIEFTRMALVYAHLIACCVAIGMVLTSDIAMVKQLLRANARERMDATHLQDLQTTVSCALMALWVSGIAIVGLDASIKGWEYFANPKLQSKITIVVLLTINGFFLHRYVMPLMAETGSLLNMKLSNRSMAIFSGAVSGVSWFYARRRPSTQLEILTLPNLSRLPCVDHWRLCIDELAHRMGCTQKRCLQKPAYYTYSHCPPSR
jgi:hypothetical protein